jgi:hypothetical protein
MTEAIGLTEGLANIASGSVLVTALIIGLAALAVKNNPAWLKLISLLLAVGLIGLAIVLYSATEVRKTSVDKRVTACTALVGTIRQGLKDKLLLEKDLTPAINIAKALIQTIDSSTCKVDK